jgi:NAD-dependent dihydropyrimidine dehydrogenase PreA subunit
MVGKSYWLNRSDLDELLKLLLNRGALYWLNKTEEGIFLELGSAERIASYELPGDVCVEPLKALFMKPRKHVADYPDADYKDFEVKPQTTTVFGMMPCDLAAVKVYDRVFIEDPEWVDPFYKEARESFLLVTADWSEPHESAFPNLVGIKTYAEDGFDLNIARIDDGYILTVGSKQGDDVIKGVHLSEANDDKMKKLDAQRKASEAKVVEFNKNFVTKKPYHELVEFNQDSPSFSDHASTCVMCTACTNVCPACYCFLLYDHPIKGKDKYERMLTWDSCHWGGFSRMAGMLNPRGRAIERFKNRYNHKFWHYHHHYDAYSCTGCGRCVDNCMGKIDMRETLKDIEAAKVAATT